MRTQLFKKALYDFLKLYGTIVPILFYTIQCSWAPQINTPIHTSEGGQIALRTSPEFKIRPQHPHIISESLVKQILQGISQHQEQGILQELLIADPKPSPVFSLAQIEFLSPHIVDALSKATSEELITFKSLDSQEGTTVVRGTVALFSPTIFFLTIQNTQNLPGPQKMANSSRNLQKHTKLIFAQEHALLKPEEAQRLMELSPTDIEIAIDYAALKPLKGTEHEDMAEKHYSTTTTTQSETNHPKMNILQEQLLDLQKKVDEQAEEIRRLQQTSPK